MYTVCHHEKCKSKWIIVQDNEDNAEEHQLRRIIDIFKSVHCSHCRDGVPSLQSRVQKQNAGFCSVVKFAIYRSNRKRHLGSLCTTTCEKRIKLLHDLLLKCTECNRKTQTRNPGFSCS